MHDILFLSKGEHSPSTRYRATSYFSALSQAGYHPQHATARGGLVKKLKLLNKVRKADVVVVNRCTFSAFYTWLLRRCAKRLIFDFDDAVFTGSKQQKTNRYKRFVRMVRCCDQVWAGNDYLASAASAHNPNVIVLPTAVNTQRYPVTAKQQKHQRPTLVWIGSSSTRKYLELVLPTLDQLSKTLDFQLKIIADFSVETEHLNVLPVQWRADTEVTEIQACHIGLAPMVDNEWTRGKCALKVLQYFAAGLPCVSSPAGVNKQVVTESGAGLLADSDGAWQDAVQSLLVDLKRCEKLGQQGRAYCEQYYSLARCEAILLAALRADG